MMLIAGTETCRLIKHLTRFTHDIFAFFVCSIYIHDGISDVIAGCSDPTEAQFGISMFSTLLAIIVFTCSMWLNFAITWTVRSQPITKIYDRTFLSEIDCL